MEQVIGLDIGSSTTKAGLFGLDGTVLALAGRSYPTYEPRPGYKEQHPEDWWAAEVACVREVCTSSAPGSILGIGVVGHLSSLTFLDAAGIPIQPSLGFQDVRAAAEVTEILTTFSRAELAGLLDIDLPPGPTWPMPRLLWFRKHEPAVLDRTRHLLQAKDYINLRLTGVFASDASSNRGMVHLGTGRPAERLFRTFGIPDLLSPLHAPCTVIGGVTERVTREMGLRTGMPVVAGWNDLNGAVLGSGATHAGDTFNVTGTSEHIGVVTASRPQAPELVCAPYLPGLRLFYGVTSCGGGSLDWFRQFSGCGMEQLLAEAEAVAPESLLYLPYLEGKRSPVWEPRASGALVGLRSTHGRGAVVRAIMEAIAFSLRQSLEIIDRSLGTNCGAVTVSGGASRIRLWNQTKADVFGRPAVELENPHAGILGAAILAATGAGAYRSPEVAAACMSRPSGQYEPRTEATPRYSRLYARYCELYSALRPILNSLDEERHMSDRNALICGAGKIARGFLAHLLTFSGYHVTFVEKNPDLVRRLRAQGRYRVHIMGAPEKSTEISGFEVLPAEDAMAVAAAVAAANVIFVSIGGPNLPQIVNMLAAGLRKRSGGVNILLAENYFEPAKWLRKMILEALLPMERDWFSREVGIVETLVLRSTIEPTEQMKAEDPLCLNAQDMWELPADKSAFVGGIPPIQGLMPKEDFQGGLIKKLFTYNAINAVIAYTGYLKGYKCLADAANDPEIGELACGAARESSAALCSRYDLNSEEQARFAASAIAKYQNRAIIDPIERNARDPLRKLSRHDRLVGPACLAVEQGVRPVALSFGIAAALQYDEPTDASAVQLTEIVRNKGVRAVLAEVCGMAADGPLADLVVEAFERSRAQRLAAAEK